MNIATSQSDVNTKNITILQKSIFKYKTIKLLNFVESTFWKSDAVVTRKVTYCITANDDAIVRKISDGTSDGTVRVS